MSLYESGDSTGEVSLKDLFDGQKEVDGEADITIERLAFLTWRGGWPQAIDMREDIALDQARDYSTVRLRLYPLGYESRHHSHKKTNNTQKGAVCFFMAEDMGLEPTGLLHLT